jgi:hypothetical protein
LGPVSQGEPTRGNATLAHRRQGAGPGPVTFGEASIERGAVGERGGAICLTPQPPLLYGSLRDTSLAAS